MRWPSPLSVAAASLFPLAAAANDAGISPAAPSAYMTECGSCHLPFPPGLLARDDWQRLMADLSRHFGEDAAVAEETNRLIRDYLVRNAGDSRRMGARGDAPRLTSTTWFRRTHGYARPAFAKPAVGSGANCGACHPAAGSGDFSARNALIPG